MAKASAISVRVNDDVKDALLKAADRDGRSMASWAERLIISHLKKDGYLSDIGNNNSMQLAAIDTSQDAQISMAARLLYHLPEKEQSVVITMIELLHGKSGRGG